MVSRNYSKVVYLKRSKSRIVHLLSFFLSFFFSQPSALMQEVTQLKQPPIVRTFPKDGNFVLSLKRKYIVYVEHLPTISKQCATMLDTILTEHVSGHLRNNATIIITGA